MLFLSGKQGGWQLPVKTRGSGLGWRHMVETEGTNGPTYKGCVVLQKDRCFRTRLVYPPSKLPWCDWSTLHPSYHGALPGIYTVKSILLKTMLIWHTFLLTVTSVLSTTHIGVYSNLLVFLTSLWWLDFVYQIAEIPVIFNFGSSQNTTR